MSTQAKQLYRTFFPIVTVFKKLILDVYKRQQTQALNDRMQLMMEQMVLFQKNRFGRSSEKMADSEPVSYTHLFAASQKWMPQAETKMLSV